jgi:hypothetical protein
LVLTITFFGIADAKQIDNNQNEKSRTPMNTASNNLLQDSIDRERAILSGYLHKVLAPIAHICSHNWNKPDELDRLLKAAIQHSANSKLLYAVNCDGQQHSSNIKRLEIDSSKRGQDLSVRPYMRDMENQKNFFVLSPVYVDQNDHRLCITALHKVYDAQGAIIGCVAADYDLDQLPSETACNRVMMPSEWRQIKGDPAIRKNLFLQERVISSMDNHLQAVNDIIVDLVCNRGVFHAKLHYSSSRATLWLYNDPHRYRLHVLEEITNPSVCLAYNKTDYPRDAVIPALTVRSVFQRFKALREADSTIYLRSASLNIINGMVGLTFSCDGSHYMPATEFLEKDDSFWGC